jgi:hypothetical protein
MVGVASLFSQLLSHFPRVSFANIVARHRGERNAKGFSCWRQFVAMIFCQLAHADSLRDIANGLKCCLGKLKHLGIDASINKSTLSYANAHRPAELYRDLFYETYEHFKGQGILGHRKKQFRFKNKLLSLDATVISLCLELFPWAKFRRAKGGVKVHVMLDHDSYVPSFVAITNAAQHEVRVARTVTLNSGSIVAMDRGYIDYSLFNAWCENKVFFVTRPKGNAVYEVLEEKKVPENSTIMSDEIIALTSVRGQKCTHPLRRIVVYDIKNDREITLLTNHLDFGATTIAAIYKERWEIELFFKALKQNLKIKTFVGTSENALHIQIWTALIAMLLLKWLHYLSKAKWSFSNLVSMLRLNLFTYRSLLDWLDEPFKTDPIFPGPTQLLLPL